MFEEWGFLLTEIWLLLAFAAALGVLAGWLFFGGRQTASAGGADVDRLRADNARLQSQLLALQTSTAGVVAVDGRAPGAPAPDTATRQPKQLDAPQGGKADDLKRIKGIGPRLEQMCNMLGFWHYDQIANWSDAEIAWVDENLQGFQGRVTRDDWVAQAKILAAGGETEFSKEQDAARKAAEKAAKKKT